MSIFVITFRSVTHAQRGERVLRAAGFRCGLQRTPKWMEEQGCGYSLRLWAEDMEPAVAVLNRNRIPFRKRYRQGADGILEVMP